MKFRTILSATTAISLLTPQLYAQEKKNVEVATIDDAIALYFHVVPLKKDTASWLRYIPTKINKTDTLLLIDSGAHRTFFDVDVAKKAKIKLKKNKATVSGSRGKSNSYTGEVDSVKVGGLMNLSKGTHFFINLGEGKKLIFDGKSSVCGGLFGADVMMQADLNIDFTNNRILASKQPLADGYWGLLKQSGYTKINLLATKSSIYIPVKLGGKVGYFQIDTGSSQMVIFDTFVKGKNYKPLKRGGDVLGVGDTKMAAKFVTVTDFQIPGRKISSPMLVAPTSKLTMIKGKPVMGVLGMPIIAHFKMIFNFKRQQLYMPKRKAKK